MVYNSFITHLDKQKIIKNVVTFNSLFPISHKKYKIKINNKINSINDILDIINTYPLIENVEYNINLQILHKIKEPLQKLSSMIGILDIK